MIFNSIPFFLFIGTFLPLYFLSKGRTRLILCLISSYLFYGWWDWRFLSLIAFSTLVDYLIGLQLSNEKRPKARSYLLLSSMIVNLGSLCFFKYFGFFSESLYTLLTDYGIHVGWHFINVILPVGISFYTFQSMSYTIDVFYEKIEAERDLIRFSTFISFFPQLVAGPIVRASDFLPQFQHDHSFDWIRTILGLKQVLWGFFKKVVIADSLAPFIDQCFHDPSRYSSLHLIIGAIFYSFQIYCDFSGYSDIAIGLARIMGFDFPVNFRSPYFSKSFSEFWKRWHISLSSWLRDYLYIPLGGNRQGSNGTIILSLAFMILTTLVFKSWIVLGLNTLAVLLTIWFVKTNNDKGLVLYSYLNLMLTMLLGGLWHGANFTFIIWGFLHGSYLIMQRLIAPYWDNLANTLKLPNWLNSVIAVSVVYLFTCLAWIYFRSPSTEVAQLYISEILSFERMSFGSVINKFWVIKGFLLIGILVCVDLLDSRYDWNELVITSPTFRVISFASILWLTALFGSFGTNSFIYFQF